MSGPSYFLAGMEVYQTVSGSTEGKGTEADVLFTVGRLIGHGLLGVYRFLARASVGGVGRLKGS